MVVYLNRRVFSNWLWKAMDGEHARARITIYPDGTQISTCGHLEPAPSCVQPVAQICGLRVWRGPDDDPGMVIEDEPGWVICPQVPLLLANSIIEVYSPGAGTWARSPAYVEPVDTESIDPEFRSPADRPATPLVRAAVWALLFIACVAFWALVGIALAS